MRCAGEGAGGVRNSWLFPPLGSCPISHFSERGDGRCSAELRVRGHARLGAGDGEGETSYACERKKCYAVPCYAAQLSGIVTFSARGRGRDSVSAPGVCRGL